MRNYLILVGLLLLGAVVAYVYVIPKRAVERSIAEMSDAVATQQPATIAQFLDRYLAPDATVVLTVGMAPGAQAEREVFDKTEFIKFVDLTIYSLEHYSISGRLTGFMPGIGGGDASMEITLTGKDKQHSLTYGMMQQFALSGSCRSTVQLHAGKLQVSASECALKLGASPQ